MQIFTSIESFGITAPFRIAERVSLIGAVELALNFASAYDFLSLGIASLLVIVSALDLATSEVAFSAVTFAVAKTLSSALQLIFSGNLFSFSQTLVVTQQEGLNEASPWVEMGGDVT